MTQEKFNAIMESHHRWLKGDIHAKRADFTSADLSFADLRGICLKNAVLYNAQLSYASLESADLQGADLRGANTHLTNFHKADLRGAKVDSMIMPFGCGALNMRIDEETAQFIAYCFYHQNCDDQEYLKMRKYLWKLAKKFKKPTSLRFGCTHDRTPIIYRNQDTEFIL